MAIACCSDNGGLLAADPEIEVIADREAIHAFRRAVLLGNHSLIEKRIRHADGSIVDVEILAALSRANGEAIIVGFVRDITKRKSVEREAEHIRTQLASSTQDLERFASIASHDLNAPLRHLRIVLESLMEDAGGMLDQDSRRLLEQGHQAALRGAVLRSSALRPLR